MKIGITGHTKGLGEALFRHFSETHEVVGMSRSNGYDIVNDFDSVVAEASTCSLFINNAYAGVSQLRLLLRLFNHTSVISCGSMAADNKVREGYALDKWNLETAHKSIQKVSRHPTLLLKMGYLQNHERLNTIPYSEVIKAIECWTVCPRISTIEFDNRRYHVSRLV